MVQPFELAPGARWDPDPPFATIDAILAPALRKAFALQVQAVDELFQRLLAAMSHKAVRAANHE